MSEGLGDPRRAALVLVDLQNDFIHADGAYARGGATVAEIAALPARLAPLAEAARRAGSAVMSTHFPLVHGVDGEPFVSEHLKRLRPFLRSEEHTSELPSLMRISYAVFCLEKKTYHH